MNIDIDITGVTLKTPRLTLRPFRQADLDDFYAYASVEGVGPMAGWQPHKDKNESQMILDGFISGKKTFALEKDGRVVGSLGIEKYHENELPEFDALAARELGFVLAKDCWGHGLMPEAVNAALDYLFGEKNADLALCGYFLWNRQSASVQRKCGFVPYKVARITTRLGDVVDTQYNILTRQAWASLRAGRSGETEERELQP